MQQHPELGYVGPGFCFPPTAAPYRKIALWIVSDQWMKWLEFESIMIDISLSDINADVLDYVFNYDGHSIYICHDMTTVSNNVVTIDLKQLALYYLSFDISPYSATAIEISHDGQTWIPYNDNCAMSICTTRYLRLSYSGAHNNCIRVWAWRFKRELAGFHKILLDDLYNSMRPRCYFPVSSDGNGYAELYYHFLDPTTEFVAPFEPEA